MTTEPDWLLWAREIQATAQIGLTFCKDPYDIERYNALRALAARILAAHTATPADRKTMEATAMALAAAMVSDLTHPDLPGLCWSLTASFIDRL